MNIVALVAFLLLHVYRGRRLNPHPLSQVLDGLFYVIVAALVAAWLPSLVLNVAATLRGQSLPPGAWLGGFYHWMWGIAGGALAGYVYCRTHDIEVGAAFDVAAPVLGLTLAIWRVGCLLNADSFGKETTSWVAMWLPDVYGRYAFRYPTQYVSIAANLLLTGILLAVERYIVDVRGKPWGWPFPGFLFSLYVLLYSAQRFFFEFWRADKPVIYGPFTDTHLYILIAVALAGWIMWQGMRRQPVG